MSDDDDVQIIEDNINYKSITCERIPDLFLDKLIAKKHFGKYGKISRFILRPNRFCCTVDYEKEEDAANARENGSVFNGQEFDVYYSPREVGHVQNTEEWVDPDVQAELDAMGNHTRRLPLHGTKIPPPAPRAVKSKPQKQPVPEMSLSQVVKVPAAVRSELEAILRKPAYTDEDKYRLLDARDKLIRLTTIRTTDIKKVVSIKGTCPDMCPEKERYMREYQHQVSIFEMEVGGNRNEMNHNTAIKEYSRSSADQEVPLTHELRPEPVLKMTMQYLMHRIMGMCDEADVNLGDWFHFVWDRTRSIRKDITQQELCSVGAVQLVEQCARFHIHCAARLVAEDPSVFDQKINTENLTKCLQTLKYMYNDLRIKGTCCENEAEFRGYIVLLNLNDANFLWELQQLPDEIQNSREVRSAVGFYKCMESNNYVRFFNLVRETTYMNACILLRYFTQVRLKAIKMIIKAYNWPRHLVSLPLPYLTKILGFENDDAAIEFFSYYGLDCGPNGVSLDKNAFEEPDVPVIMDRAFELVESKRQVGVGEAVCGQLLDSPDIFESHKPHNSFDNNGYLRYETQANGERQDTSNNKPAAPTNNLSDNVFKIPKSSSPLNPKQQLKSIFASEGVKPETPSIFSQSASSSSNSIFGQKFNAPPASSANSGVFKIPLPATSHAPAMTSTSFFGNSAFQKPPTSGQTIFGRPAIVEEPVKPTKNIFGAATSTFASDSIFQHFGTNPFEIGFNKPSPSDIKLEQQQKFEQQRLQQEEQRREKAREEEEQAKQRQREELERQQRLAEEQKRIERKRKQDAITRMDQSSRRILHEIISDVVDRKVSEIASIELKSAQQLEKLAERVISEYIQDFIKQVHSEEIKIIRKIHSLLYKYFHMWREIAQKKKTQRQLLEDMPIWMTTDTLEEQAERMIVPSQDENLEMIKRYRLGYPCDFKALLNGEESQAPINVHSCINKQFSNKLEQHPTGFIRLRRYFKLVVSLPGEREELPGFNSYANSWFEKNVEPRNTDPDSPSFICHYEDDLALCVRKVSCINPRNEQNQKVNRECDHTNAVLFLMSAGNASNTRKRLHHLFKLSAINLPVPLVIIAYRNAENPTFIDNLELKSLVDDEKVSNYLVLHSDDMNMRDDFQESLQFLAENNSISCPLEAQNVISFLDACLGDELWQRLHNCTNPLFRKVCTIPRFLVTVYNEAIDQLIDIVDEDFRDYPEFPEELKKFVPPAKYDIPVSLEQFPDNWKDTTRVDKLVHFLRTIKLEPVDAELPEEIEDLELWILNYTSACIPDDDQQSTKAGYNAIKCLIMMINSEEYDEELIEERLKLISWLPIFRQIALAVLNHRWSREGSELFSEIIYNRDEIHEFLTKPWWLDSSPVKAVKIIAEADESSSEETENPDDTIEAIIARGEKASLLANDKLKQLQEEADSSKPDPELTRGLDETLHNFEVSVKCRTLESAMSQYTDDDDSLESLPNPKRKKENTDKLSPQQIMERAFSVIQKAEDFMDIFREPLAEIQMLDVD